MSIAGKVVARVLLIRLQALADRVYPKSPCCFLAGRSTTDMIFTVRQLQEKSREQGKLLYLVFIDATKAFDLVIRDGPLEKLWGGGGGGEFSSRRKFFFVIKFLA